MRPNNYWLLYTICILIFGACRPSTQLIEQITPTVIENGHDETQVVSSTLRFAEQLCPSMQEVDISELVKNEQLGLVLLSENINAGSDTIVLMNPAKNMSYSVQIKPVEYEEQLFIFSPRQGIRISPDGTKVTYMLHNQNFEDAKWLVGMLILDDGSQRIIGHPTSHPWHYWLNNTSIIQTPIVGGGGFVESQSPDVPIYLLNIETNEEIVLPYPRNVAPKNRFEPLGDSGFGLYWDYPNIVLYDYISSEEQLVFKSLFENTEWNFSDPGIFQNVWQVNYDGGQFDVLLADVQSTSVLRVVLDMSYDQIKDGVQDEAMKVLQLPQEFAISSVKWISNNRILARLHQKETRTTRDNFYDLVMIDLEREIVQDYCLRLAFGTTSIPIPAPGSLLIAWSQDAGESSILGSRSTERETIILNTTTGQYSTIENYMVEGWVNFQADP